MMFYFRKMTGAPWMSDSGVADIVLGGQGLTVRGFPSVCLVIDGLLWVNNGVAAAQNLSERTCPT